MSISGLQVQLLDFIFHAAIPLISETPIYICR